MLKHPFALARRLLPAILIGAIAAALVGTAPAQARADDRAGTVAPDWRTILTVPLTVVSADSKAGPDQSTAAEPCGVLWIGVYNLGGGTALLDYGFQSYVGAVLHRKMSMTWINNSVGGPTNIFFDDGFMASSSYRNTRYVNSGPGTVTATNGTFIFHYVGVTCVGFVGATNTIT